MEIVLEDKKMQLQKIKPKKIEGMLVRPNVKWLAEGSNHIIFCNLENRNFTNKDTSFPEKNGEILSDQYIIDVHYFYLDLYKHQATEYSDLNSIKLEAPKLSQNDSYMLEGKIAESEALGALRKMKNDNSSGADGFTTEFY